jgi:hypothetical protein
MRYFLILFVALYAPKTFAQNVGIGTTTPQTPLDLRSSITSHLFRLDGISGTYLSISENGVYRGYLGSFSGANEDMDFSTGAGNSTGKLHLGIQANPKLTIDATGNVGINTTNPQWQLDVNGSMKLAGRLFVNGTSGVTGQVLTSNGLAAPSWQTLAGASQNNVRFDATFLANSGDAEDLVYTSVINTNTTAVSIPSSGVTINKTGLYHIEGFYESYTKLNYAIAPYFGHSLFLNFGTRSYTLSLSTPFESDPTPPTTGPNYRKLINFVQEVYIIAPTTISFYRVNNKPLGPTPPSYRQTGRISGYLISE